MDDIREFANWLRNAPQENIQDQQMVRYSVMALEKFLDEKIKLMKTDAIKESFTDLENSPKS